MKALFKTGDDVKILSGEDKGKTGKVLVIDRKKGRVMVEGVNLLTHYERKSEQNPQGAILKKEGFIDISNVAKTQQEAKKAKAPAKKEAKK